MKENYFNDFQSLKVVFDEKEGDEEYNQLMGNGLRPWS